MRFSKEGDVTLNGLRVLDLTCDKVFLYGKILRRGRSSRPGQCGSGDYDQRSVV